MALALAAASKFFGLAVVITIADGWTPQNWPWGFLVALSGPFVIATVLIAAVSPGGPAAVAALVLAVRFLVTGTGRRRAA